MSGSHLRNLGSLATQPRKPTGWQATLLRVFCAAIFFVPLQVHRIQAAPIIVGVGETLSVNDPLEIDGNSSNQGTVDITQTGELVNHGTLANHILGSLFNHGELNNTGTLDNDGWLNNYGTLDNDGWLYNLGGWLNNSGTLDNDGWLYNAGELYNLGTLIGDGAFTQYGGELKVDGSMTQGAIDIQGGALSGNGTISSTLSALQIGQDASVNPGSSTGTLTVTGDMNMFGTLVVEVLDGLSFDLLNVNGAISFSDTSLIDFILDMSFTPVDGMELAFLNADSLFGFDLLNFSISGLANGFGWNVNFDDVNYDLSIAFFAQGGNDVPEPATLALLGLGLAGLGFRAKRKKLN